LLLTACNKDGDTPPTPSPDEKGVVRVTIDGSGFNTRASFPGNDPTNKETPIYNYAILVFNENQILEHIEPVSVYTSANPSPKAPEELGTSEFEVTLGTKYFFVVANVPVSKLMSDQDNFSPDQDVLVQGVQDYILELESVDQIIGYLESGNTVNSNEKNRGFMMTTLNGLQTVVVNKNKDDGDVNEVELPIGRAMAKVAVREDIQSAPNGTLKNIEYKVGHNPKKMYVVPHYHRYTSGVMITPNYEDETVDANAYFGPLDDYQSADDANSFTYCLENANKIPKMGNATVVYLKGKFEPATVVDKDKSPSTLPADGSFWRIKNTAANALIKYEPEFYSERPDVAAGQEAVEYKGGISYYTLYLANEQTTTDNKYTVKRNSYYKVTITKVSNAGEPDDDEEELIPEPEIPLDGAGLIEATIKIVDWDPIEQDGEI
ncbi:MAG: Mfa1 family fimbria major subunit, partial [Bacteroides sp.]|nr:Mfa1 family fimbria major subunit [Bacteroides sp.]